MSQKGIYEIPLKSAYESPIEGSYDHEKATDLVTNTSFPHREKVKNKYKEAIVSITRLAEKKRPLWISMNSVTIKIYSLLIFFMDLLNKKAPAFSLLDQNEKKQALKDYLGKKVLLYFYPKDDTPGCTTEACSFRDRLNELKPYKVQVLGVSCDDVKSHRKFAEKFGLNFPLLADTEKKVVEKYGVWGEKSMYGRKYMGIQRDSFLIDEKGKIIRHYEKVKPADHVDQVIADLKTL